MKKILLTWYGMTDFRSALGFENGGCGPILNALMADDYAEAIVLECGVAEKQSAVARVSFADFLSELASVDKSDLAQRTAFIQKYASTSLAHECFEKWLAEQLAGVGCETHVCFRPISLKSLTDVDGIYAAENDAVTSIAREHPDAEISLFLSPGTPVMAYNWALAALKQPNLKKRLIVSSLPGKNPDLVRLPAEWNDCDGPQRANADRSAEYDVCVHLFSEQRLPCYYGVKEFPSRTHLFVTSKAFQPNVMKPFLDGAEAKSLMVDPYSPDDVRSRIVAWLEKNAANGRVAFNLTAGTKLMYAGAFAACREVNGTPFYFNIKDHSVINLQTFKSEPIRSRVNSVELFVELNGRNLKVKNDGKLPNRPTTPADLATYENLCGRLVRDPRDLASNYLKISQACDEKKHRDLAERYGFVPFKVAPSQTFDASIDESGRAHLRMRDNCYDFGNFPGFAKFVTGGWFETCVYRELKPYLNNGEILDLRIGFEVAFDAAVRERGQTTFGPAVLEEKPFQEFDVSFTDGSRLYIVECKAGGVTSEQVQKLESNVKKYGGESGRGILAVCFDHLDESIKKRLRESKSCSLVVLPGSWNSGRNGRKGIGEQIMEIVKADRKTYVCE